MVQTGDIHFVHGRTPTHNVITTMNFIFYEKESLKDIDIVVLTGDVWDSLTTNPNPDSVLARQWISRFVKDCADNDVILRVLEGTPDHDRKQSVEFVAFETTCDVKHITELCVEYIERLDMTFLWVPDEIRANHEEIWAATCQVLAEANLTRVDVGQVHGGFDLHFPAILELPAHDSERYSSIVKYGVFCNHIHKAAQFKKIWGPGSPDRLAHNEEGPKGYHRVTFIPAEERMEVQWIENPHAWIYKAIDVRGLSLEDIVTKARAIAMPLHHGAYVRLDFGDPTIMSGALTTLRVEIPHIQWELKNEKKKGIVADKTVYKKELYTTVQTTPDNALGVMTGWLISKNLITPAQEPKLAKIFAAANQEL